MVVEPREPFTSLRFAVGIEHLDAGGAVEVIFPESRIVTLPPRNRRVVQHTALTIRRGLTASTGWYDWWHETRRAANPGTRLVTVVLLDDARVGRTRWFFPASVPQAYSLSPLNALQGSVVIESLEIKVGDFLLERLQ